MTDKMLTYWQERAERAERAIALVRAAHYLDLNANDVFAWGCADVCQMTIEEGFDLYFEMHERWGAEGEFAFMAEGRGIEPQEPWFTRGHLSRARYDEAREFVRGKSTGIFKSGAYDEQVRCAEYDALRAEVDRLRAFVSAHDAWAESPEHCGGELFEAMLGARDALKG